MTRPWMTLATSCLALVCSLAAAEEIDADYRMHDEVVVRGRKAPLTGTILSGRTGNGPLKIRLLSGIEMEIKRSDLSAVTPRETPETAFRARAKRLAGSSDASLHRRLAEWGYGLGLIREAEGELRAAVRHETDAVTRLGHRVRLVRVLEERGQGLDGAEHEAVLEAILEQATAGAFSPSLALAHARVALQLELPELAPPLLEKARSDLEARAADASATPPGDGSAGTGEGGEDGDEGQEDPGDAQDAPDPPTDDGVRRFGRDGDTPDRRGSDPEDAAPADGEEPDDFGDQKIPGLSSEDRELYRQVLSTLGETHLLLGDAPGADEAFARLLEIWPQDQPATLGHSRVLVSQGKTTEAIDALSETLKVHPQDADLLLLRGQAHYLAGHDQPARSDLEAAVKAAGDPDSEAARDANVTLAYVHVVAGRFGKAVAPLDAADGAPGYGPARLGKGLLAELGGDAEAAATQFDEAKRLLGSRGAEVDYTRGEALADSDPKAAASSLRAAIREGYAFTLAARALVDLARRQNDAVEEGRLLELLYRSTPQPGVDLLAAMGRVLLIQRRQPEAKVLFERGLDLDPNDLDCLSGLAYCAYAEDQREVAKGLFQRVLAVEKDNAWAKQGLKNLTEADTRRVWSDGFDRADGEVLGGWRVESPYGVKAQISGGHLVFSGEQSNQGGGKTVVSRTIQREHVEFEVELEVGPETEGRVGIRMQTKRGELVLFRDPLDERLKVSQSTGKGQFTDPVDLGPWPGGGRHALAIDVDERRRGMVALLIDGRRAGEVKAPGLHQRQTCTLVIYGQGPKVGDPVNLSVHSARVYVLRKGSKTSSGGGY